MKRYVLNLSYDGTFFKGWQKQNGQRTVQAELEKALSEIAKKPISVFGAGRTDASVHAINQFAHFDFDINMTENQIRLALLSKLDKDIKIKNVFGVSEDFNARFSAKYREYVYLLTSNQTPFNRYYKTYTSISLDLENIRSYLPIFIGEYDFSAFSKKNPEYKHYLSNVTDFEVKKTGDTFVFRIKANRFLHNMVRRLVGTVLIAIQRNIPPSKIKDILLNGEGKNEKIVHTAAPYGLYLANVFYEEDFYCPEDVYSNVCEIIF